MNTNYIRFFVSSTFADMQRERNLLHSVLQKLHDEYLPQGWIIEWTDLRWGISQEAGLDNRTMRICLNELRRCRQLSPRPNFIVLMGERYGWVPLPEVIPFDDIDRQALAELQDFDRSVFELWYSLDTNALPRGEYILQPRSEEYTDNFIWENLAEKPLKAILPLICKGATADYLHLSATAQEIVNGLDEVTAKDTLIYRRHLSDMPADARQTYCETAEEAADGLIQLHEFLDRAGVAENLLAVGGRYAEYESGELDGSIAEGMYERLHAIIVRVIAECSAAALKTENQIHLDIAARQRGKVAGRENIIHELIEYIDSPDKRPILITSESGIGKSALMRELVNRISYRSGTAVIARFCGETAESSEAWSLLDSILADLDLSSKNYIEQSRHRTVAHTRLTRPGESSFNAGIEIDWMFCRKVVKPVVIIIDGLDLVDDSKAEFFFDLPWLDVALGERIKVIVSSTPDKVKSINSPKIRRMDLPVLGSEAPAVVNLLLNLRRRTLSSRQQSDLLRILAHSDTSGIYLSVLAGYLANTPSWIDISTLPSDFDGLMTRILDELRLPAQHGATIVDLALRFISATRLGISDPEMRALLSADNRLAAEVQAQCRHEQTDDMLRVPPIFWARLQADLGGLLRQRHTPVGIQNTFSHARIADYVNRHLMSDDLAAFYTLTAVYNHLVVKTKNYNPHALYECARLILSCLQIAWSIYRHNTSWENNFRACCGGLDNLMLSNGNYILGKAAVFRDDLINDYYQAIIGINSETRTQQFEAIKREILELPQTSDIKGIIMMAGNMPDSYILHRLAKPLLDSSHQLTDRWRNSARVNATVYGVTLIGESPCISADGKAVACLLEHGTVLSIEKLSATSEINANTIVLNSSATALRASGDLCRLILTYPDKIEYRDIFANKTLAWNMADCEGYISRDGKNIIITYHSGFLRYNIESGQQYDYDSSAEMKQNVPSPSGRMVWSVDSEDILHRYDIETDKNLSFGEGYHIVFTSDEICVQQGEDQIFIIAHVFKDNRHSYKSISCNIYKAQTLDYWYDESSESLFVDFEKSVQQYNVWEDDNIEIIRGRQPGLLTVNGEYALRAYPRSIVRWRDMLDEPYILKAFNVGIGSFSASRDGSIALMSSGINSMQESYPDILYADNKGVRKLRLPFKNSNYGLVTSVAVSPDGRFIGASSNSGEIILVRRSDMSLIDSLAGTTGGCLGISFSEDSCMMLAVVDHNISSPNPTITLADTESGKIYLAPGQLDWTDKRIWQYTPWPQGFSRLFGKGRYAVLGDFFWDIKKQKAILPIGKSIKYHDMSFDIVKQGYISRPPLRGIFEDPASGMILFGDNGTLSTLDPETGKLTEVAYPYALIGLSCDGSYRFLLSKSRELIISLKGTQTIIARDIMAVFPYTDDTARFYAYTTDRYIIDMDIKGQERARTYVPDLWHAIPTKQGLAIATLRGPMLLQ